MPASTYLIVGGGMTAAAAIRGIREVDREGAITVIAAEADPPYKRPPLSKGLWNGKSFDRIWYERDQEGVTFHLGRTVVGVDAGAKRVVDDRGASYRYDKLLLATGSRPRMLPGDVDGLVIHFRTLDDYRRLRELTDRGRRFAVIGGGFIGSEIAAALATNGKEVTLLFPGEAIGDRIFPADLAHFLNDAYRARGVDVRAGEDVTGVAWRGRDCIVRTRSVADGTEREFAVDGVVAGIGTIPNVEVAQAGGLKVSDGIVVDRLLRTSHPDVYAAGDVANVWMPALGKSRRVEHEDNAKTMGRMAGRAMAGQPEPYDHLPFFYSDLFDMGYEAVGELDARMRTVADWSDPYREGTVYYLEDDRVRGVLLWNVWGKVDAARELIRQPGVVDHLLAGSVASG